MPDCMCVFMCFMFDPNSRRAMQSVAVDVAVAAAATSEMQFLLAKLRALFFCFFL